MEDYFASQMGSVFVHQVLKDNFVRQVILLFNSVIRFTINYKTTKEHWKN